MSIDKSKNILELNYYKNQTRLNLSTDCLEECGHKEFYQNYSKQIDYKFNSKGFRDYEWPKKLSDVIWCVGDSATLGVGQPFLETWPQVLQNRLKKRCLNISSCGASNDTIALRALEIIKKMKTKKIIIMWTFLHRRRKDNEDVHIDKHDFGIINDLKNFSKNFHSINEKLPKAIHLIVPKALSNLHTGSNLKKMLLKNEYFTKDDTDKIVEFEQLDLSRDYFHWGIKTNKSICDLITKKINAIDF